MLDQHKKIFFQAAHEFSCWIGLREPNELSDKWCGRPGFRPKGEECKAKTADNPDFAYAGLVVDPILCPHAFRDDTRATAVEKWKKDFLIGGKLPPGFGRVEHGAEKGLVRYQGKAIFADFDLMAISKANDRGDHLYTTNTEENALFNKVSHYLN